MGRPRGAFDAGKEWTFQAVQTLSNPRCVASNEYLAGEKGCSVRQIARYIAALVAEGRLRRTCVVYVKWGRLLTKRVLYVVKKVADRVKAFFGVPVYRDSSEKLMDTTTLDPQVVKVLAEQDEDERRQQEKLKDVEFQRKKHERSGLRLMAHTLLGGFRRPVRHSPLVQVMLNDLERREKEGKA